MNPGLNGPPRFPVFALQPIADVHHAWAGMMLAGEGGTPAAVARLFGEFGLAAALDGLACVVPCELLIDGSGDATAQLSPQQVVALCTARPGVDASAEPRLKALHQAGFRILQTCAEDVIAAGAQALACDGARPVPPRVAGALRRLPGPHLALGVDTPERFEICKAAGFTWMAGDYPLHFASVNFSRGSGPAHQTLLKLLALVVRDAETREIEAVLKQDPQLSFQLLRLVNSAAFAHASRITTFNQAITILGRRQLQRWLQLLLYAHLSGEQSPLLPRAAYRARFLEALCEQGGGDHELQDRAFMTGIFSLLDAVFGRPLPQLLQALDLAADVAAALLEGRGHLGQLLEIVRCERPSAAPTPLRELLSAVNLDAEKHARAMVEACHWAVRVGRD
jgi:EAL and modified HD-GYP domain-containing signal transduction protein